MKNDIRVNLENLNDNERETLLKLIEKANKGKRLSEIAIADTFKLAGIEWIKFHEENGRVIIVAKDIVFNAKFDDDTNNLAESSLLRKLEKEVLAKIEAEIGANNVLEFETDLWALDGTDEYGKMKSKISLPTFDFYRQNRRIFSKYHINKWWWLATPDSTDNSYVRCVDCVGTLYYLYCSNSNGVRPFCILKSNIFVSRGE